MHAASRLFSWSMELFTFASHLFAPKMLDHILHYMSVNPIHSSLRASAAGGTARFAKRLVVYTNFLEQDASPRVEF